MKFSTKTCVRRLTTIIFLFTKFLKPYKSEPKFGCRRFGTIWRFLFFFAKFLLNPIYRVKFSTIVFNPQQCLLLDLQKTKTKWLWHGENFRNYFLFLSGKYFEIASQTFKNCTLKLAKSGEGRIFFYMKLF